MLSVLLAVSALVANTVLATPPGCVISCLTSASNGTLINSVSCSAIDDYSCVCSNPLAASIQSCLTSSCPSDEALTALQFYSSTCSSAGKSISSSSSVSASASASASSSSLSASASVSSSSSASASDSSSSKSNSGSVSATVSSTTSSQAETDTSVSTAYITTTNCLTSITPAANATVTSTKYSTTLSCSTTLSKNNTISSSKLPEYTNVASATKSSAFGLILALALAAFLA